MNTPSINRYKNHRFPAEIISHGVWLYFRFCLSYRDVEELLFARGIIVTYEAIRKWCRSQGVQLAKIQELVRYWGTDYDWRKAEAKLNALPQFMTTIDGVDIHFIHVNLPATVPAEIAKALNAGGPAPAGLSEQERAAFAGLDTFYKKYRAYAVMMATRPQTIGYALTDSPVGLAAWMYDYNNGEPERLLTTDEMLDDITLYWLTNSATSAARLYWENNNSILNAVQQKTAEIALPVAITVFPEEIYRAPETWARRAYRNLIYFHEVDKGGHFAAWEEPQLFSEEIRAAFRSLR